MGIVLGVIIGHWSSKVHRLPPFYFPRRPFPIERLATLPDPNPNPDRWINRMATTLPTESAAPETGHKPYVPDEKLSHELAWPAVMVGALLGIVFGASSIYLVLKVGMTVSASIPVAVLSITLFRAFSRLTGFRKATILENNITQTTGSAGESIAFGVGVTMPALYLLGFEMDITRVATVGVLGGLLGILMMIPLRRAFVVKQHGKLKYPEGTACADVLIVGEQGGASARAVFTGFGLAFVYAFFMKAMKLWKDTLDVRLYSPTTGAGLKKGVFGGELDPALLGVGYIIGPRIASIMVAGGVLAYLVFVPAIAYFGEGLNTPLAPATAKPIKDMSVGELRTSYIIYIGAGAVATGGIISMVQALPVIFASLLGGLRDVFGGKRAGDGEAVPRTERDMPMWVVGLGSLALVAAIAYAPSLGLGFTPFGLLAAGLIVLLGFLFVTVSSRLTGEVGSSSNPISGMTVAALLIACMVFVLSGHTTKADSLTALTIAAVVCIASSNGGTTSQDLKTGFLVGATPSKQQWAILVGTLTSALVIGYTLLYVNEGGTVYSKKTENVPAYTVPAATLAKLEHEQRAGGQYDDDPTEYKVFLVGEAEAVDLKVPQGKYLADESGKLVYFVDPAINGKLAKWDNGRFVKDLKYAAPKTQLMQKIITGIFDQKLPWGLVLLGALVSITLELCGVPSLPFAVGVYLPLETSVPIFLGGAIRFVVEKAGRLRGRPAASEGESEMSPGSLLSTGYIAGAAIAGIIYAVVASNKPLLDTMSKYQYRTETLTRPLAVEKAYEDVAKAEVGPPPAGPPDKAETAHYEHALKEKVGEVEEANETELPKSVELPAGTKLTLLDGSPATVESATTLGAFAVEKYGKAEKAAELYEANKETLKLPTALPAGAVLKVPQRDSTAAIAAGAMVLILLLVGLLLKPAAAVSTPVHGADEEGMQ
jgi:putative OPT family oligopeptide transporter